MRARVLAPATLSLLSLSACVSTSFRPAEDSRAGNIAPVPPSAVHVLSSPPDDAFLRLGEIHAYLSGFPSDETVIREARERAATIGADAIIVNPDVLYGEPGGNTEFPHPKPIARTFTAIRLLSEDSARRDR